MTDTDTETTNPSSAAGEMGQPLRLPARPLPPNPDARPVRKDEISIADRGLHIESWLPERRSRRKPLLFIRGELAGSWLWERYLGYFARRGWEGHALNLRNHYWSQTADPARLSFATYTEDVVAALDRLGPGAVIVGHGMGGLLALKAAERHEVAGLVLVAPYLPKELRTSPKPHELREIPAAYGQAVLGWDTLPERLHREHRDLTLADILRIQHLLGQKPRESGAARRQMLQGIPIDRRGLGDVPILAIGGGLDRYVAEPDVERLATWLGATYEPFGAHSHYGLILGEESYQQVADAIRAFLEAHRI
jgi:pimeloyl-ACP methyl ester carboxylesterase